MSWRARSAARASARSSGSHSSTKRSARSPGRKSSSRRRTEEPVVTGEAPLARPASLRRPRSARPSGQQPLALGLPRRIASRSGERKVATESALRVAEREVERLGRPGSNPWTTSNARAESAARGSPGRRRGRRGGSARDRNGGAERDDASSGSPSCPRRARAGRRAGRRAVRRREDDDRMPERRGALGRGLDVLVDRAAVTTRTGVTRQIRRPTASSLAPAQR